MCDPYGVEKLPESFPYKHVTPLGLSTDHSSNSITQ